jgi:RHS repeat-associated protein
LITKVKNNFGFLQNLDLELEWDNFKLLAVSPFLKKLDYNSNGDIDKITYDNGLIVNFKFADDGKSLGLSYVDPKNQEERVENLTWNRYDLISTKNGNLTSEKIKSYRYTYNSNFELTKTETQNSTNTSTIVSDSPFKADSYNKTPLDVQIENDLVSRIDGYTIKYGGLYSIAGVSKGIYKEVYVADDVHVINQHIIEYVRLADRFVGVIIHGPKIRGFFPIITDHLNSVRVIFDKNGAPLVQREYDSWGNAYFEKIDGDQGKILSQLIRYDFAGLIRPFGSRYLIARHRVYAPHLGRWLTLDPMLQWDPKKMIKNHSQELDGYKYALGNPVVFIDKTGTFATVLPALGAGFVAGGTTFGYQYLMNGHDAAGAARDGLVAGVTTFIGVGTGGFAQFLGLGTLGANLAGGAVGGGISEGYNIYKGGDFQFSRWLTGLVGTSVGGALLQNIPLRAEGLTLGGEIALEGVKAFSQTQGAVLYDVLTQGSSHREGVRNDYSEQVTIDKKESLSFSDYSGQYMCPIDGETPKK